MAHAIADYDYELPKRLIAQHPLQRRSDARLLVVDRATASLQHHHIRDLPGLLRRGDCLVINDTRVIPARVVGFARRPAAAGKGFSSRRTNRAIGGCWPKPAASCNPASRLRWSTSGCRSRFASGW